VRKAVVGTREAMVENMEKDMGIFLVCDVDEKKQKSLFPLFIA
jgi:hypothetical protein